MKKYKLNVLTGKKKSFVEKSYADNYNDVLTYVLRMAKDVHLAEDVTSNAFIKLCEMEDWESITKVKSFMRTVAKNLMLDHFKRSKQKTKNKRRVFDSFENGDLLLIDSDCSDASDHTTRYCVNPMSPERIALIDEMHLLADKSIGRLLPTRRQSYVLHRFSGYKHSEIAKIIGISEDGVEKNVRRSKQQLRKFMRDD